MISTSLFSSILNTCSCEWELQKLIYSWNDLINYVLFFGNLFGILSLPTPWAANQLGDSSTSAPTPVQRTRPIYALVIGINEYASPNVQDLEGAVPDALAVKKYLTEKLGVPEPQICLLCNGEATQRRIIGEFKNLVADQRVSRGDPILIYYAGHGGEAYPLIPHDFRTTVSGKEIKGIPDRTIGALLSRVAEKWGDNITVILDCCRSGFFDRPYTELGLLARATKTDDHVAASEISGSRDNAQSENFGAAVAPALLYHDQSSYMLLAACTWEQVAYERKGALCADQVNGVFTAALLNTLYAVCAQNISYAHLFQRLPILDVPTPQTPQCLGANRHRVLFDPEAQEQVLYRIKKDGDSDVLDAGAAHGIKVGDEFTLCSDCRESPLSTLVVLETRPFHSTIVPCQGSSRFELDQPAFALRTKAGTDEHLRVYVADTNLTSIVEALVKMNERSCGPRILVVEEDNAMLGIDLEGDKVAFDIFDERVTAFNRQRILSSIQPSVSKLGPIIDAAAHFYWHLNRNGEYHNLQNMVHLELTEVKPGEENCEHDLHPAIEPAGKNLSQNSVIEVVANNEVTYSIRIINDTAIPLYPFLFYFDNSNLSITSLYQPGFAGQSKVHPPLPAKGCIRLGYGSRGGTPKFYRLNRGQDVHVRFLKLFLSTDYVDLSNIPQSSPFLNSHKRLYESAERFIEPVSLWDTILVTLVIRKE